MMTNANLDNSPKQRRSKAPNPWPTWLVKAMWDSTAMKIKVVAKNEIDAKERAWKQVARMEGGLYCLNVTVLRRIE